MRYRAFGNCGTVVSALSVGIAEGGAKRSADDWTGLIFAALESGINCFELVNFSAPIAEGMAHALQAIDRELIFVGCRMGRIRPGQEPVRDFSGQVLGSQLRAVLGRTGLGYLDLVMLDDPKSDEVTDEGVTMMKQARDAGLLRLIGFSGADDAVEDHLNSGRFDVMGTPYNLTSGWRERNWLRTAGKCDVAVIGYEPYPADFHQSAIAASKARRAAQTGRVESLDGVGSYDFLDHTKGWSAEEICLAHALTEPGIATVQLRAPSTDKLERLASITEREMPPGLSAQIEMGRFAPMPDPAQRKSA